MAAGVWAIVVAGGEGRRFGGPKQFERVGGRLVVEWAAEAARSIADGVILVVPKEALSDLSRHAGCEVVVAGGETRSRSVRAGLAEVPGDVEVIVVHDAARPLATPALFSAVVAAVQAGADAAIPGVAVRDTLKEVRDGRVVATIDRESLIAVQTPQAFRAELLRRAHQGDPEATDDAALVEALGGTVAVVAGEVHNRKITDADDVAFVDACLGIPVEGAGR